jgi:hypothetical protein
MKEKYRLVKTTCKDQSVLWTLERSKFPCEWDFIANYLDEGQAWRHLRWLRGGLVEKREIIK